MSANLCTLAQNYAHNQPFAEFDALLSDKFKLAKGCGFVAGYQRHKQLFLWKTNLGPFFATHG